MFIKSFKKRALSAFGFFWDTLYISYILQYFVYSSILTAILGQGGPFSQEGGPFTNLGGGGASHPSHPSWLRVWTVLVKKKHSYQHEQNSRARHTTTGHPWLLPTAYQKSRCVQGTLGNTAKQISVFCNLQTNNDLRKQHRKFAFFLDLFAIRSIIYFF